MWRKVATGVWTRRVSKQGQISIYNRPRSAGRQAAGSQVQIQLVLPPGVDLPPAADGDRRTAPAADPSRGRAALDHAAAPTWGIPVAPDGDIPGGRPAPDHDPLPWYGPEWVIRAADGTVLRRHPARELAANRITNLDVTYRKPAALRRRRRPLVTVADLAGRAAPADRAPHPDPRVPADLAGGMPED